MKSSGTSRLGSGLMARCSLSSAGFDPSAALGRGHGVRRPGHVTARDPTVPDLSSRVGCRLPGIRRTVPWARHLRGSGRSAGRAGMARLGRGHEGVSHRNPVSRDEGMPPHHVEPPGQHPRGRPRVDRSSVRGGSAGRGMEPTSCGRYFRHVPLDELTSRTPDVYAGAARSHLELARNRLPGCRERAGLQPLHRDRRLVQQPHRHPDRHRRHALPRRLRDRRPGQRRHRHPPHRPPAARREP